MTRRATHQIVEFLLSEDGRSAAAAAALTEGGLWTEAIALAIAWKVIPQLSARIQSLKIGLNPTDARTLRREFLKICGRSAVVAASAIRAFHALQHVGIRVAGFKGIASMAVLYGDPRRRSIGDADLLISRQDLTAALACLAEHGFARSGSETLDEYLQFVVNAPRFAGNQSITLFGEEGTEIDLHWELAGSGLGTAQILERAGAARLTDSSIPVVDPRDGFALTVHHAIREDLGIESVCRDLLDAQLWCAHLRETGQLENAMKWAARSGCQVAALAVTSILRGYDDTGAAARASGLLHDTTSPSERRAAAYLSELFHYQLRGGRIGKDVLYLVHPLPWRQILRGLTTDWSGYRRSMRTIEKHVGRERTLIERAALLAKSIPGPRGLKLARELARVKYRAAGRA